MQQDSDNDSRESPRGKTNDKSRRWVTDALSWALLYTMPLALFGCVCFHWPLSRRFLQSVCFLMSSSQESWSLMQSTATLWSGICRKQLQVARRRAETPIDRVEDLRRLCQLPYHCHKTQYAAPRRTIAGTTTAACQMIVEEAAAHYTKWFWSAHCMVGIYQCIYKGTPNSCCKFWTGRAIPRSKSRR